MPKARYRISINGFVCSAETWDDILGWDGKHDEVFITASIKHADQNGAIIFDFMRPPSRIMGDTNNQNNRVRAGSASPSGGIISGDRFPTMTPWYRSGPLPALNDPLADVPPCVLWEGDLSTGSAIFVTPAIWEWDPGQSVWEGWMEWHRQTDDRFGAKAKEIYGGRFPLIGWIFDAVSLGIQTAATLFMPGGPIGSSASRPIGMKKHPEQANTYVFNPWVIVLTQQSAEDLIAQQPIGLGNGVLAIRYDDDPALRGDYSLYLQVERVGIVLPDPQDDSLWREEDSPAIYVVYGGAPFWVPDPATLNRLYGPTPGINTCASGAIQRLPKVPRDGTLLKEEHSDYRWYVANGQRRLLVGEAVERVVLAGPGGVWPRPVVLGPIITPPRERGTGPRPTVPVSSVPGELGGEGELRVVPDNALAGIPVGPDFVVGAR